MYPKGKSDGPGWANGEADVERAVAAYRAGTLSDEKFASITQDGKKYVIAGGTRLGLVPHRDELVARFCLGFDDHDGDGGNVHLAEAADRFLGVESIKFTSNRGKGLHCYYSLSEPIPVDAFVEWAKAWGFNKRGDIECFPKTPKRTQVWLTTRWFARSPKAKSQPPTTLITCCTTPARRWTNWPPTLKS